MRSVAFPPPFCTVATDYMAIIYICDGSLLQDLGPACDLNLGPKKGEDLLFPAL